MKLVIIAGDLGSRIAEETHLKLKPLVEIGRTNTQEYYENIFFFMPEGFVHGFQLFEDNFKMIYIHLQKWSKLYEAGINCKDKDLKNTIAYG